MPDEVKKPEGTPAATVVAPQQTPVAPQQTEAKPEAAGKSDTGTQEPQKDAASPAPKDAELKLPEGVEVDQKFLEKAKETFKTQGMSTAQQQAVVDAYAAHAAEQNKAFTEAQAKQREEWRTQIKSDPVLGGAKFDASQATVAKAVDKFFGEEGRKLFDLTGFGDHPAIFRALHQIGVRVSEDSISETVTEPPRERTLSNIYDHPTSRSKLK